MASLVEILSYYSDRLIAQYRDQPNARATIEIYGKQITADDLASTLELAFSIDTAVGAQLDVLGKYIGVSRDIGDPIPDMNSYFGFADYTGPANENGMNDYTDSFVNPNSLFYLYQNAAGIPSPLDDESYRTILKFQILVNISDSTLYSIQQIVATLVGPAVQITDAQDMNLVYAFYEVPPISLTILRRFLPRPLALGSSVVLVSDIERVLDTGESRVSDTLTPRALIAG